MKEKFSRREPEYHSNVFCTGCGAEMDLFGNIKHKFNCLLLKSFFEDCANIQQQVQADSDKPNSLT